MIAAPYDPPDLAGLVARASSRGLVLDLVDATPDARGRWRNRTYRLHLQPALWGGVDVVWTWGRRGTTLRRPRSLVTHHRDEGAADTTLAAVIRRRSKKTRKAPQKVLEAHVEARRPSSPVMVTDRGAVASAVGTARAS